MLPYSGHITPGAKSARTLAKFIDADGQLC